MRHVVTGATGFLGRHLIDRLTDQGDVVALVRQFDDRLDSLNVEQVEGDLTDVEAMNRAIKGADFVYHLAGRVERDRSKAHLMYELHVDGTRRLLDTLVDSDVKKIVVASTSGTVGVSTHDEEIADDESPYAELLVRDWPYYLSKIYAERVCDRYVRDLNLPIVMLRPTLLLGPGDDRRSSTGDVELFLNRGIPTIPNGGLSFVDVRDVADAFLLAATDGEVGEKYLLGAANMTLETFFETLEALSGVPAPKWQVPQSAAIFGARLADSAMKIFKKSSALDPVSVEMAGHFWYIDSSRAERELGFRTRDPKLTLRDTVRDLLRPDEKSQRPVVLEEMLADR